MNSEKLCEKALAELGVFYGSISSPQNAKYPEIAFRDLDNMQTAFRLADPER